MLSPVTIVPRLDISRIVANVTAPPYAGAAKTAVNLAERSAIDARRRAGVDCASSSTSRWMRVHRVTLVPAEPNAKPPDVKWNLAGGSVASGAFEAGQSFRFSVGDATRTASRTPRRSSTS